MNSVCQKRQAAADELCEYNNDNQRQTDNGRDFHGNPVNNQKLDKIDRSKSYAAHDSYAQLLPYCLRQFPELHFIQGERADNGNRSLRAGIPARIHQHRDICCQNDIRGKRFFITGNNCPGERR